MIQQVFYSIYGLLICSGDKQGEENVGVGENKESGQEEPGCHHCHLCPETRAHEPLLLHSMPQEHSHNIPDALI